MTTAANTHLVIADDHPLFRDALRNNGWSSAMTRWVLAAVRSEEHTSELQSLRHLVCRLLLEKKKKKKEEKSKRHTSRFLMFINILQLNKVDSTMETLKGVIETMCTLKGQIVTDGHGQPHKKE